MRKIVILITLSLIMSRTCFSQVLDERLMNNLLGATDAVQEIANKEVADGEVWSSEEADLQVQINALKIQMEAQLEEPPCDCASNDVVPKDIAKEGPDWQLVLLVSTTSSRENAVLGNKRSSQVTGSVNSANWRAKEYDRAVEAGLITPAAGEDLLSQALAMKDYAENPNMIVVPNAIALDSKFVHMMEDRYDPDFGETSMIHPVNLIRFRSGHTQLDVDQYMSAILFDKMLSANSAEEVNQILSEDGGNLEFEQQLKIASMLTAALPYSDPRSEFDEEHTVGLRTLYDMLVAERNDNSDDGGICGDIHTATNTILSAMNPDLQLYTMSYATPGNQHVVSVVVDPTADQKLHVINYSNIHTTEDVDGTEGLTVPNSDGLRNMGTRVRLFKNQNGSNTSVATLNTPLGELLQEISTGELMKRFHPSHYNSNPRSNFQGGIGRLSEENRERMIDQGIKMISSRTTAGEEVLSVLVNTALFKQGEVLGRAHSVALSYNKVTPADGGTPNYVAYLTTEHIATALVEKVIPNVGAFSFGGFVGARLDAELDWMEDEDGELTFTGDGNLSIPFGVNGIAKFGDTSIEGGVGGDFEIGLHEQTRVFDFDYLPQNAMFFLNSLSANATLRQELPDVNASIYAGYEYLGIGSSDEKLIGEVGSLNTFKVGYSGKNVNIEFGYSLPGDGFSLLPGQNQQFSGNFEATLNEFIDVFGGTSLMVGPDGKIDSGRSSVDIGARIQIPVIVPKKKDE